MPAIESRPDFSSQFPKIAELLACSTCGSELRLEADNLICTACGAQYPIVNGIPVLTPQKP